MHKLLKHFGSDEEEALAPVSRSNRRRSASRFAVLRHPLFVVCLVLLLVNDHALKGAGLLPGTVTGKLSDFAGLLVAPVLVAALFGVRSRPGRAAAFAAVALPFTAIKLSAWAATTLVTAMSLLGVKWRIWQDPGDLVALVMLFPAWRLSARAASESEHDSGSRRAGIARWLVERALVAVAGLACVATSSNGVLGYSTTAYLVNATDSPLDVRVRWVDAGLDCDAVMDGDPTRILGAAAFDLGITFRFQPAHTLPLERDAAYQAAGAPITPPGGEGGSSGAGTLGGPCEVVLIEVDGMPPTLVWWDDLPFVTLRADVAEMENFWIDESLVPGRVLLVPPVLDTPGSVERGQLQTSVSPSTCAGVEQGAVQWTSLDPTLPPIGVVEDVHEIPGGCLELRLSHMLEDGSGGRDTGAQQTLHLCVPLEDFPFSMGDEIQLEETATSLDLRAPALGRRLALHRDLQSLSLDGIQADVTPAGCEGDRLSCGGYTTTANLTVTAGGETSVLDPGDVVAGPGFTLRLGRAERVIAARADCGPGLDHPGLSADLSITWK